MDGIELDLIGQDHHRAQLKVPKTKATKGGLVVVMMLNQQWWRENYTYNNNCV